MSLDDAVARLLDSAAPAYVASRCSACVLDRHHGCTGSAWSCATVTVIVCTCDCRDDRFDDDDTETAVGLV